MARLRMRGSCVLSVNGGLHPDDDIFKSYDPTPDEVVQMAESAIRKGLSKGLLPGTLVLRAGRYGCLLDGDVGGSTVDYFEIEGEVAE